MIEMEIDDQQVEHRQLGEGWIRAVRQVELHRLEEFCQPDVVSVILTPKRYLTLESAGALSAKYGDWFGSCTDFQVVSSRIDMVGERLGIFYSFLLQDGGDWYRIEQQLYCTLRDGLVQKMHLLCSGFQPVGESSQPAQAPAAGGADPVADTLLEFRVESPETSSTCAVLTPMIRSKLNELRSGQVLEVRVNDPSARDDVEAWSRLSGNTLLKVTQDGTQSLRFFVQKK